MKYLVSAIALLMTIGLSACNGHDDDGTAASSTGSTTPVPGSLITNPPQEVASMAPSTLVTLLSTNPLGQTFLKLAYSPTCTVSIYHLTYNTTDPAGNLTAASGALMVPSGAASGCSGPRPIVIYAHGTTTDKDYDIAQLTASDNAEGILLAAVFAAQGYIVIAPNYLGYDISTLGYHPYLIGKQQSDEMIDALSAGRAALPTAGAATTTDGGKLFITGYSEGGYVALATHSAMQSAGMTVTASAPMSGPYALAAFGDAIFEGEVSDSANVSLALLTVAYQNAYGNIYSTAADLFESNYAASIPTLLPNTTPVSALEADGQFPTALFNSTAPGAAYAIYTPATSPANLASVFAAGFGTNDLVNNTYRSAYLADALANPDGGFPTLTTGVPAASPANTLRAQVKINDLRNWVPSAPTLLCGGDSDPTVFFFNTTLMQDYWTSHPPATAPVYLDVDSSPTSNDPYATLKTAFAAAKAVIFLSGGESAVLADYHATLVPPFCLSAVKSFFDTH